MIEEMDRKILDWAGTVLESAQVVLAPPGGGQPVHGASFYLLELRAQPPFRESRPPLQIGLRYLVTTWADNPQEEHRLLSRLVFAALEQQDFELESEPPPAAIWATFGLPPRPAIILRALLRRDRPLLPHPVVKRPLVVDATPPRPLHGVVVSPDGSPVAAARVEVESLRLASNTDASGRFRFVAVPAGHPLVVRVHSKGGLQGASLDAATAVATGEPLVIRLQTHES